MQSGQQLYSLREYSSAGFPSRRTVKSMSDREIATQEGDIIPLSQIGTHWTDDWMTSLLSWEKPGS